jgi:glycosyltransferase involved in cell wall biosynthesis
VAPNKAIHETVIALMVTRAHRDPEATLLIVGKPAIASYDAALHRYVAEMGLQDAVTFAGHASDATVAAAYAQADVLVVTSQHEGFCVPVTEAMAVGLPVVAYAQGALPEVLGAAGVLVDSVDPYGLAATIADLLADPARCRELAAAGRNPAARARPAAARCWRSAPSERTRPTAAAKGTGDLSGSTSPARPPSRGPR